MSTQFFGIPEERFKALAEQRRSEQFLAACRRPEIWLNRAFQHRRGADILYQVAHSAYERDIARFLAEINSGASTQSVARKLEGQEIQDFHDQGLLAEYLLLIGYALECVLKGYLLAIFPKLVKDDKRLDKLVTSHDLSRLCHDCSITLSPDEQSLLQLLTRYIVWGKYPVPIRVDDMPSWIDPRDQEEKSLAVSNAFHQCRVQLLANGVFNRAASLLEHQRKGPAHAS